MPKKTTFNFGKEPVTRFLSSIFDRNEKPTNSREFRFENMEERCVLSANGLDFGDTPDTDIPAMTTTDSNVDDNSARSENFQTSIASVTVNVGGELRTIQPTGDRLQLDLGQEFEVVDINFASNATGGTFALEGYISKIEDQDSASLIDYEDGRFSQIESNYSADGRNGFIPGLDGGWTAQSGWDRLTINLIHYRDTGTAVADRAIIQIETGNAEFAFDASVLEKLKSQTGRVGESFEIYGAWENLGSGEFHNYAEVDIYHASNKEEIVWAGALVGNASIDNRVEGYFVNTRNDDAFSENFTPQQSGQYVLRFYLDPEGVVEESDESNNQMDVIINVSETNSRPIANHDAVLANLNESLDQIDVLKNDIDLDNDQLDVERFTQPKNGKVNLNPDGTFSYTPNKEFSGIDEFKYTISDGTDSSNTATVQIEVAPGNFSVNQNSAGKEDTLISLEIDADPKQFSHVRVSNIPDQASLSHGVQVAPGIYDVAVNDLSALSIKPELHSDSDFELAVTPFQGNTAYLDLTDTIKVSVNAVADGGKIDVANFGIVTGSSGRLPFKFSFSDLDQSESHKITFHNLPDFISLSAGEKVGQSWVLNERDLTNLKIESNQVDDLTGFRKSRGYYYKRFDVSVTLESVEQSNGDSSDFREDFVFYAIQRVR